MADHLPKFLPGASVTFTAEGNVTRGRIATPGGSARAARTAQVGDVGIGTFAFNAVDGEAVNVHTAGLVDRVIAAEPIAVGDQVAPDGVGQVRTMDSGHHRFGIALTASATPGEQLEVLRLPEGNTTS